MMQNHYNSDGKSFEPRILYQDKLPIKCESRIETFLYLFIYYFFGGKEPLLYFGCWQPEMEVEVVDACPKGNSPPLSHSCDNPGIRAFIGEGKELHAVQHSQL